MDTMQKVEQEGDEPSKPVYNVDADNQAQPSAYVIVSLLHQ